MEPSTRLQTWSLCRFGALSSRAVNVLEALPFVIRLKLCVGSEELRHRLRIFPPNPERLSKNRRTLIADFASTRNSVLLNEIWALAAASLKTASCRRVQRWLYT